MPKPSFHTLVWSEQLQCYQLHSHGRVSHCFRLEDEPAFTRWLEAHTSFAFVGQAGRLSVIKEARTAGAGYWYAYRKQARHTHKRYLGATPQLTLARLEQVAKELGGRSLPPSAASGAPVRQNAQRPMLLSTKLAPPHLPSSLVRRSRLLNDLHAVPSYPLTLVCASAGSGKTTLLAAWAAAPVRLLEHKKASGAAAPVAWLSLEELDNDPTRFWAACIVALQTCAPGVGEVALAMLHAQEALPLSDCLLSLLHELEQVASELVLILDDYHVIADQTITESMHFLLDHLPPNLHLVLATRTNPELPLARLRVRGQLLELRDGDLRWTPQEASSFLVEGMGLPLSQADVTALQARTEGWIAGLQLAALSLRKHDDVAAFLKDFAGSHRFVLDYVQQDILARLPDTLRDFVLQTAVLSRLHAALCQAVTMLPTQAACQDLLEALEWDNLFLVPLDGERHWYRFHDLFREALLAQLQIRQPEHVSVLHIRAARWYEAAGEFREAIAHALAAPDYPYAASLMEQAAPGLWRSGEAGSVQNWLLALPDPALVAHVRLALDAALHVLYAIPHHVPLVVAEVAQLIARLEGLLHGTPTRLLSEAEAALLDRRLRLLRAFSEARAIITGGDTERLRQLARDAEALPADAEVQWNLIPLSLSYWLTDFAPKTKASLLPRLVSAKQHALQTMSFPAVLRIMLLLSEALIKNGQLHQARRACLEALALLQQSGTRTILTGFLHLNRFTVAYAQNHLDEAAEALHNLLHIARTWRQAYLLELGEISLVRLALARGELHLAHQACLRLEALFEQEAYPSYVPREEATVVRVEYWLASGNLSPAVAWAAPHLHSSQPWGHLGDREMLLLVRVLLARRQYREAAELLARLWEYLDERADVQTTTQFLALSVVAHAHAGRGEEALRSAARLFALTDPESFIRVYLDAGLPMKRALERLREAHTDGSNTAAVISPLDVSRLLAAFEQDEQLLVEAQNAPPDRLPSSQHTLREPLSPQELQVLRRLCAGQTYAEIAEALVVSSNTIKTQVSSIYRKLGVHRRTEAIAASQRLHLL